MFKRLILASCLFSSLATGSDSPINLPFDQTKVIYEFMDFLNGKPSPDCVQVTNYKLDSAGFLSHNSSQDVSQAEYERYNKLTENVFTYKNFGNRNGSVAEKAQKFYGSAFSIGHNLVLTSLHVLDRTYKNTTKCSDFKLYTHKPIDRIDCKEVLFCDVTLDFCLVEMKPMKKPTPGLKIGIADTKDLRTNESMKVTVIGNAVGEGLKVSQAKGLKVSDPFLIINAPVAGGNSGGPALDDHNQVIGIVRAINKIQINEGSAGKPVYGFKTKVVNMAYIIKSLRTALASKPETLAKFNEAVAQ